MQTAQRFKVAVVGGGTAGWMSAATIAKVMGSTVSVELVESEEIGTVGVGEATIPAIKLLNSLLEVNEDEFIAATKATFKLGIEFVNWKALNHSYFHGFGGVGLSMGMIPFYHYWLRAKHEGISGDFWDYAPAKGAAMTNRFTRAHDPDNPFRGFQYAFHFDAGLYALFLRSIAEKLDVRRKEGRIVGVELDGTSGFVKSLNLDNGLLIEADLFIDCSGFKGLLIEGALKSGYTDWTAYLPCDRAVTVPSAVSGVHTPYTRSTAHKAGWQWRIPLQHRVGNGYVFSSAFTDEDTATEDLLAGLDGAALADPKIIRFTTGHRNTFWNKNVIAMGLASGFLEPLESTSIHMVQSALQRLIGLFPGSDFDPKLAVHYNRRTLAEYEDVRDFIVMHYKLTQRTDSPFWRHCAAESRTPDSLLELMTLFSDTGYMPVRSNEIFLQTSWVQVAIGQGLNPKTFHPMAKDMDIGQLADMLSDLKSYSNSLISKAPSAHQYLKTILQSCSGRLDA